MIGTEHDLPPLAIARHDELQSVVTLVNTTYRGTTARQGWTHEADYIDGDRITLRTLQSDLAAKPKARLLLQRSALDGGLIGCAWLEPKEHGTWYVGLLTVRPDQQARRLGHQMLEAVEDLARHGGALRMRLTVVSLRQALISWYERRGYHLTGEMRPFPPVEPPRPDLQLAVLEKALVACCEPVDVMGVDRRRTN